MKPTDTSDEEQESGFGNSEQGFSGKGDVNEEDLEEDFDLSAILAELDEEENEDSSMNEAKEEEEAEEEETEETPEESEEETGEEEVAPEAEETDGDKITDLTVDALKDIIKDIIHAELEQEEYETPGDEEAEMGGGEDTGMEMSYENQVDEEINLEELLAELDALDEEKEEEDEAMYEAKKKTAKKEKEEKDEKDEMKEAIDTINALRNELNETNLLNAKLLYVNKIFKAKNLTESQKLKVIASFDKATTPIQAKELFESIQSSNFGASKKTQIKESLGFASKAAGVAPKSTIVESNDVISRMQKLANIIK